MTLKLPRFIRRITTVWVWAAPWCALKEATCWVLKGHTVPQWQRYRVVRTQSLNDTLEINFFHLARVESIERIKLHSSSRLSPLSLMHTPKSFSRSTPMAYQAAVSQCGSGSILAFCAAQVHSAQAAEEASSRSRDKTLKVSNQWHTINSPSMRTHYVPHHFCRPQLVQQLATII